MRPIYLKAFMTSLETAAGATTSANDSPAGRWKRIAAAAEALAGETSSANSTLEGYRLRTAVALEVLSGTDGTEENRNETGMLKRIVDALDALNGTTVAGSLEYRIATAADTAEQEGNFGFEEPETTALLARFSVQPNATRKGHINDLIAGLKADGVWELLDALYIMAAHDEQAGQRNWIADAYNLIPSTTVVTLPTFEVDRGYTGDGLTAYLDTGFNPTTEAATAKYVQNSAHVSVWSRTAAGASSNDMGCPASNVLRLQCRANSGDTMSASINSANTGIGNGNLSTGGDTTTGVGHFIANRSASNAVELYQNGSTKTLAAAAKTSSGIPNANIDIGRVIAAFSARQFAAASIGASLDATKAAALAARKATFMTAVGA